MWTSMYCRSVQAHVWPQAVVVGALHSLCLATCPFNVTIQIDVSRNMRELSVGTEQTQRFSKLSGFDLCLFVQHYRMPNAPKISYRSMQPT